MDTFSSFGERLSSVASKAASAVTEGVNAAGDMVGDALSDLGLKYHVEAAGKAVQDAAKGGGKKLADANKAMAKARRLANRALDFDEDDGFDTSDYELLLSAVGAEEKSVPIHGQITETFIVPADSAFVYKARVRKGDIGFSLREIREPNIVIELEHMTRYRSDQLIQAEIPATEIGPPRTYQLVFDNSHSHMQRKNCAMWVTIGQDVSLLDDAAGVARSKEVAMAEGGPDE
jgi:hypothetical protein